MSLDSIPMPPEESFPPENAISREDGGGGNRTHEPFPTDEIDLAGLKLEVKREGKFLNLHCYVIEGEGTLVSLWNFEPLDQAIPKLEALLAAAKLAAAE